MKTEQLAKIPAMLANPVPRLDMDGGRRAKMQQFIDDLEEELCFDTAEFYKDLLKDDVKLEPTTWSFLGHEQAPVIDGEYSPASFTNVAPFELKVRWGS